MTYNGTSGSIALDAAGDRTVATYNILNIYNEAQNSVGTIDAGTRTVTTFQAEIFPGNTTTVPVDFVMACSNDDYNMTVSACANSLRTVTLTQNSEDALRYCPDIEAFEASCDHASLKSAGAGLVMFGYAFIFIFLLALARVWSHKVIRLSQRKFLLIMIFGAFVALAGPLLSANQLSDVRCAALPCFTAVGYVLLFGPLFVKSWRVSVLMNNSRLRSKKVSNWRLYRRLAALIVATVGLLAVMLLVDPPKPQTSSKPVDDADGNVHLVPFETCAVESGTLGMLVILLLGLMTAYGCFVSYQIRHVTSELSEARWIFLSVYNGALLSMVTLAVVLGLDLTYAELHLFASLGSVLTCMVTVSLIMVPKLINIHKDVKFT
ncbi:Metabotropic glutamate receptor-like protein B, partial [Hondaea fermentalgiana]